MRNMFVTLSFCVVALLVCVSCEADQSSGSGADEVRKLSAGLQQGVIQRVMIYRVPYEARTFVGINQDALPQIANYKCETILNGAMKDSLLRVLREEHISTSLEEPDLRWGAIFMDSQNRTIFSVYVDGRYLTGSGRHGIIQGRKVEFNGRLLRWFETNFSMPCLVK